MKDDPTGPNPYASPPCLAHELDATCSRFAATDADTRRDVMRWRSAERERLYRLRESISPRRREAALRRITRALDDLLARHEASILSAYWPIRGEPDLRPWMRAAHEAGYRIALPLVSGPRKPLEFGLWKPGDRLRRGAWGIAEPADAERVEPELLIAPLLGVDAGNYRLGNGGGYFDRTLAAAGGRVLAIGVGFEISRIATIYPLEHDIPMQVIITG